MNREKNKKQRWAWLERHFLEKCRTTTLMGRLKKKNNKKTKHEKGFYPWWVPSFPSSSWRRLPICWASFSSLSPPLLVFPCFGKWGHRGAVFLRLSCETEPWTESEVEAVGGGRGEGRKEGMEKKSCRDHFYTLPPSPTDSPGVHYPGDITHARPADVVLEY